MATSSVVGGQQLTLNICDSEVNAATQALDQLESGYAAGAIHVLTSPTVSPMPMPGQLYIFDLPSGSAVSPPSGQYGTIISDDLHGATVSAKGSGVLVIGNNQGDSISITGTGTMYTPDGGEFIGSGTVITGAGNDVINVKGDATILSCGGNDSITVQLGNANITVGTGNDTISLGGPNDTVTTAGSATVTGPSGIQATVTGGQLLFQHGAGGESVMAGSGTATLAGGSGLTFIGGTGSTMMQGTVGGGGNDTYVGGSGNDTMTAGHGAGGTLGNLFQFDTGATPEGGSHVITNFSQGHDTIQLGSSYDINTILSAGPSDPNTVLHDASGNAVLSLDGGATQITFLNVQTLNKTDFK
jgi:Ca2+-binding RTX toxin-like protein